MVRKAFDYPAFPLAPSSLIVDADVDWWAIVDGLRRGYVVRMSRSELQRLPNYQRPPSTIGWCPAWRAYSFASPYEADPIAVECPSRGYNGFALPGPEPHWWLCQDEPAGEGRGQQGWHVRLTRILIDG
jgi:hypothetical protein